MASAIRASLERWRLTDNVRSLTQLAGGKRVLAGQPQAEQRYKVTCRWQPGIKPAMRIVWPMDDLDRILNIESAYDVKGLHQQLEIVAAEIFPEE